MSKYGKNGLTNIRNCCYKYNKMVYIIYVWSTDINRFLLIVDWTIVISNACCFNQHQRQHQTYKVQGHAFGLTRSWKVI